MSKLTAGIICLLCAVRLFENSRTTDSHVYKILNVSFGYLDFFAGILCIAKCFIDK